MQAPIAAPHGKHCAILTPNVGRKLLSQSRSLSRRGRAECHQQRRHTRRTCVVQAAADDADKKQEISLAPAKPKSPAGEMVTYYLKMQPHLFHDAVNEQFRRLQEEKEEAAKAAQEQQEQREKEQKDKPKGEEKGLEVTLYRRVAEMRDSQQRASVEDLMYASVLEKFVKLKVDMLPRLDSITESQANLKTLTEGIHSKEALDLVREHVLGVMGSAGMAYSNTMLKMSKLQAAQVYAASIMFGYFVRRVDKRFQLDRQLGLIDEPQADAVARLERLFNTASDPDDLDQPASPSTQDAAAPSASPSGDTGAAGEAAAASGKGGKKKQSPLRRYIQSFDQATLADMTRQVSLEGAALVQVQTSALFGDLTQLQSQMQQVVGQDAHSMEELMQRVQQAVEKDEVQSLSITVGTQRRAVLEAIAFGTFLRDVESYVDQEYQLLTPILSSGKGGKGGAPPIVGL